jgi:hypothetical protein
MTPVQFGLERIIGVLLPPRSDKRWSVLLPAGPCFDSTTRTSLSTKSRNARTPGAGER